MNERPLTAYERWMVKSNIETARTEGTAAVVATLRTNGYLRVAKAVDETCKAMGYPEVITGLLT